MKRYLATPGPTTIPEEVLAECAKPIIHHRTKDYQEINREVSKDLQYIFCTQNPVFVFASSGTGAMEAAVCNILSSQDTALILCGGKFGERWAELCEAYSIERDVLEFYWGDAPDPEDVRKRLSDNPKIKAVFTQLCETSTGVLYDIENIAKVCREFEKILVVDAISGLCADPLFTDEWGVDVVVAGSQKGVMCPPGLSFISVSKNAFSAIERSDLPKYYFSLAKAYKSYLENDTPFTPAVSLVRGLSVALNLIKREGLANVIKRHKVLAEATRCAVAGIGLELLAKRPSSALTAVKVPDGIDGKTLTKRMKEFYGVNVAGGQGRLTGAIFRIAHLGYAERFDVVVAISALEMALSDLGFSIDLGKGVAEAERVLKGFGL
jgi:aspartate aminotransferase-like enzyme